MYGAEQGGTWAEPALNFYLSAPDVTTGQASGFAEPLPPGPHLPQRQGVAGDSALGRALAQIHTLGSEQVLCAEKALLPEGGAL